jgi:LysR family transcriptional regulator, cys regulon transcriptional activator
VRNDLNLTEASLALNTSQSGVSKQIRELEIELGLEIFVRKGKRLTGLTRAGEGVVKLVERVLQEAEALKRHAKEFAGEQSGRLAIATTHNQARYVLPMAVSCFAAEYPGVQLELMQVTPGEAAQFVASGEADVAIATEALDAAPLLETFPCFSWRHVVIAPSDHPLAAKPAEIEDIAGFPLITYNSGFTGRAQIDAAFSAHGIEPDVRLAAMDSDVIKTYVALGLGLGVISEMAFDGLGDPGLRELPRSRELFAPSVTKVAVLRGGLLPTYAYRFIELLAPHVQSSASKKSPAQRGGGRPVLRLDSAEIPGFEQYKSRLAGAARSLSG